MPQVSPLRHLSALNIATSSSIVISFVLKDRELSDGCINAFQVNPTAMKHQLMLLKENRVPQLSQHNCCHKCHHNRPRSIVISFKLPHSIKTCGWMVHVCPVIDQQCVQALTILSIRNFPTSLWSILHPVIWLLELNLLFYCLSKQWHYSV